MAIDSKSPETIGAGHGYGGMLLQVEEVYNDVKNRFGQTRFMGGFVDRNVRGGSTKSMHAYGRAFDIGGSSEVMQQIAEYLRKINGVNYIIYNRKISSKGGAWRTYNGENPHTDHVHADFLTSFKGLSRKVYTVKPGETLSLIAKKLNMKLNDLIKSNPQIKNINVINPGDKIYYLL